MIRDTKSSYCPYCRRRTLAQRQARNELIHSFNWAMAILTCGLWLPITVIMSILIPTCAWVCSHCGSEV